MSTSSTPVPNTDELRSFYNKANVDEPTTNPIVKSTCRWTKYDTALLLISAMFIVCGLVSGLTSFFVLQAQEVAASQVSLNSTASLQSSRVQGTITNAMKTATAISALFQYNDKVMMTPTQLDTFVNSSAIDMTGILGLEFAYVVTNAERQSFEAAISSKFGYYSTLYQNFTINVGNSPVVPAPTRSEYLCLTHAVPFKDNANIIGYNIAVYNAANQVMLDKARSQRINVAGDVFPLIEGVSGFLIMSPSFNSTGYCMGVSLGVFVVDNLFYTAIDKETLSNIDVIAVDTTSGSLVFDTSKSKNYTNTIKASAVTSSVNVQTADRIWRVYFVPKSNFYPKFENPLKWVGLFVSLVLALLLVAGTLIIRIPIQMTISDVNREKVETLEASQKKLMLLLQKFARQETKARFTINQIDEVVIGVDVQGKVVFANDTFDEIFKYTPTELEQGLNITTILYKLDRDFFTKENVQKFETQGRTKSGDESNFLVSVKELPKAEGEDTESHIIILRPTTL
jgi:CHASE1-domain containing sensor protein